MREEEYFQGVKELSLLAKKEVGQNFLIDCSIAKRIVDQLEVNPGEKVLEIGSGAGSLTYYLSQTQGNVEAIDIDEAMITKTSNDFANCPNLKTYYGNAMRFDYSSYDKIIGNLPYYITSGILERVFLGGVNCKKGVFMVQDEAGVRYLSKPGTKEYGPLSALMLLVGTPKKSFPVSKKSFAPAPHVDSLVFEVEFFEEKKDLKLVYFLMDKLFMNRRKTIFNNLKNLTKEVVSAGETLKSVGISESLRPEQVTPEQYWELSKTELVQNWYKKYER